MRAHLVNQFLPVALASVRDDRGFAMPEAIEVLVRKQLSHVCALSY